MGFAAFSTAAKDLAAADLYVNTTQYIAQAAAGVNSLTKFYDERLKGACAEVERLKRELSGSAATLEKQKVRARDDAERSRLALDEKSARVRELEAELEAVRSSEGKALKELRAMRKGVDAACAEYGRRERRRIGEAYAEKYAERFDRVRRHLAERKEADKTVIMFGQVKGALEVLDVVQARDGVSLPDNRVRGLAAKRAKLEEEVSQLDVFTLEAGDLTVSPVSTPPPCTPSDEFAEIMKDVVAGSSDAAARV